MKKLFSFVFALIALPFKIIGFTIKLAVLIAFLWLLFTFMSCSGEKHHPKVVSQVKYNLPYEISTISENDIPRSMSDGPITAKMVEVASTARAFFEKKSPHIDHEKIRLRNAEIVRKALAKEFIEVKSISKICQQIADNLTQSNPELDQVKVYCVRRTDRKPFVNACTIKGYILIGKELFDLAKNNGYPSSLALIISHELAHSVISFDLSAQEEHFIRQITNGVISESLQDIAVGVYQKVIKTPIQDAEESMADLIAIKLLADHNLYDPIIGLKIYNKLFNTDEDKGIDWMNTHGTYHREPSLMSLLMNHRIKHQVYSSH